MVSRVEKHLKKTRVQYCVLSMRKVAFRSVSVNWVGLLVSKEPFVTPKPKIAPRVLGSLFSR